MCYNYSVIIPCRDRFELLRTAVESVPDQGDIQIIIIDNSEKSIPVNSLPHKDCALVEYMTSSPNKGAGCARNVGLTRVKGRYVLFLDADDFFLPTAFVNFNRYLECNYDIVYFKSDSINVVDGTKSSRHVVVNKLIEAYKQTGEDGLLRYRFVNPIAKMIRSDFLMNSGIQFDEIPVCNDMWFSVMTGHMAKTIAADDAVVYMITAGESGSSLTRMRTSENWFIRFQVMVRVNQFLKSVGKYHYRTRLLGALRIAYRDFGFKEAVRLLRYAYHNKVDVF